MSFLDLAKPLSLYSIPAVWFTAFYPHVMKVVLLAGTAGYNNVNPRGNVARVEQKKHLTPSIAARAARMEGAHLNGHEALPLWIAAVLAGNLAGVDTYKMNMISLAYVSSRVFYNWVYINHTSQLQSLLRTAIFGLSTALPLYVLIHAGDLLRSRV